MAHQINRSSAYLSRNKYSYCFRFKIPKDLYCHFGKKELRYSLRTGYLGRAKHRARLMAGLIQKLIHYIRVHKNNMNLEQDEIAEIIKTFKTFKDKAGIDPTPRWKTYHSFRHTVVQHLKIHEVPEPKAAELVGHKVGGITYGLYGTTFQPELIFEDVVMVLDWHEKMDLTHLK